MNNNEFEYSEKTKRRVRIFKRLLSFIVLILAIATMVALFYVKKEKIRVRLFFSLLQYIAMSIVLISPRLLKKFANFEVPVEEPVVARSCLHRGCDVAAQADAGAGED